MCIFQYVWLYAYLSLLVYLPSVCLIWTLLSELNSFLRLYNWLVSFFSERTHCTDCLGLKSPLRDITASIVQGWAIGPVAYGAYVITVVDLNTVTPGKYADDTHHAGRKCPFQASKLSNFKAWSQANNLTLNHSKTTEIVFTDNRRKVFFSTAVSTARNCMDLDTKESSASRWQVAYQCQNTCAISSLFLCSNFVRSESAVSTRHVRLCFTEYLPVSHCS